MLKRFWRAAEWPVVWTLAATAFVLGFWGFSRSAAENASSLLDRIYLTLQLLVLESGAVTPPVPWQLEIARFLAPAVAAYTATQALALIFREELHGLRVRLWRDHVVVCGLGRKGLLLVRAFRRQGAQVVAIERNPDNEHVAACRDDGAVVFVGSATDAATLTKAGAARARYVVAVCDADGTNAEVALCARDLAADRGERGPSLTCFAHIVEPRLCDLLREREIARHTERGFRLEFFNVFESGARALLDEQPLAWRDGRPPHPLVIGLGRLGQSLVVDIMRAWREIEGVAGRGLRVSVVDKAATRRLADLRVPAEATEGWELLPYDIDVRSAEFERGEFLLDASGRASVTDVYVCFDDDAMGVASALTLQRRASVHRIPVIVRTIRDGGLATLLGGSRDEPDVMLRGFGLLDRTCTPDALISSATTEMLARAIHAAYVRSRGEAGDTVTTNPSMVPWDRLPEELKEDNRKQADDIARKIHAVGCRLRHARGPNAGVVEFAPEEIERLAHSEHERWVSVRQAEGWRHGAGPKDLRRKTHPALVPWSSLAEAFKETNRAAIRSLPSLLAHAGLDLYRRPSTVQRQLTS